ncbi:MAG: 30S ribosomal protein S18 [Planctomycetes bacterium]|nr:30S ribosomal protein S18 [Planctomycetota bacterium]MBL7007636.1 30S ribosomal protein S18 [Planctomycetota bacterium]
MMDRFEKRKPMPKVDNFDYKDIETLQRFLSPQGRIHSRKRTGLNARKQRELKMAIKTARFLALLPYDNR